MGDFIIRDLIMFIGKSQSEESLKDAGKSVSRSDAALL